MYTLWLCVYVRAQAEGEVDRVLVAAAAATQRVIVCSGVVCTY